MQTIFKYKKLNKNKLIPFGFAEKDGNYVYETKILDGQFNLIAKIDAQGEISVKVIDTATNEPYTLHLVDSATGSFVGEIRHEYERVLTEIADNCFEMEVFKSIQAHEIIDYVYGKFGGELEYLWEKFPSNAVWRRKDNNKWYGALLTVSEKKFGLPSDEVIEIIDLRAEPETVQALVDNKHIFAGYHMNKKHWITIPLNGILPSQKIYEFIDKSYALAKK